MRKASSRGYCVCCGVQRDEEGRMVHDIECIWYKAGDLDYLGEDGERVKIFCPYIPIGTAKPEDRGEK